MNKAYFISPAVLVLAFFGYWYGFKAEYEKKINDAKIAVENARLEKQATDKANRQKAIEMAVEANAKRKAEREAKQAKEKKEKEDREAAIENRNKLRSEQYKLAAQQERLTKEVEVLKDEISKVEANIKAVAAEQAFVKEYVKKAEANAKAITVTADKIDKADSDVKRAIKELTTLKTKPTS